MLIFNQANFEYVYMYMRLYALPFWDGNFSVLLVSLIFSVTVIALS